MSHAMLSMRKAQPSPSGYTVIPLPGFRPVVLQSRHQGAWQESFEPIASVGPVSPKQVIFFAFGPESPKQGVATADCGWRYR